MLVIEYYLFTGKYKNVVIGKAKNKLKKSEENKNRSSKFKTSIH